MSSGPPSLRRNARLASTPMPEAILPQSSTLQTVSPTTRQNPEPPRKRQRLASQRQSLKSAEEQPSEHSPDALSIYPPQHALLPFDPPPFTSLSAGPLRIVTWNVCSLRSMMRSGALVKYAQQERPHILCVQETKMTPDAQLSFDGVPGYIPHWHHSQRKGHFGVAIFIRDDVSDNMASDIRVSRETGDPVADSEGRVITLFLPSSVCVVNAYVPNSGGKLARLPYRTEHFEPAIRKYLAQLAQKYSVIYCGDLNVAHQPLDIHNSKGNMKSAGHTPQERDQFGHLLGDSPQWVDCFRRLHQSYPGYTYYSKRFGTRLREQLKGWRLDYFLVDGRTFDSDVVSDCFVRPLVDGSDHYPLVIDIDCSKLSPRN